MLQIYIINRISYVRCFYIKATTMLLQISMTNLEILNSFYKKLFYSGTFFIMTSLTCITSCMKLSKVDVNLLSNKLIAPKTLFLLSSQQYKNTLNINCNKTFSCFANKYELLIYFGYIFTFPTFSSKSIFLGVK